MRTVTPGSMLRATPGCTVTVPAARYGDWEARSVSGAEMVAGRAVNGAGVDTVKSRRAT